MNFGPLNPEKESLAMMDRALDLGINFFDTADVYGGKRGEGATEQILGRWFAQGGSRRERVVLATKVFGNMEKTDGFDRNLTGGLSARKIVRSCEASLHRMQTDFIDLYQMHHVDRNCPFDEIWQAMETLIAQGKVLYTGSSNFAGWDIATAQQTASRRHFVGLVSEQSIYSLDNRLIEWEVIPACRHYGLGLMPWSPLGRGLLGGALKKRKEGRRSGPDFEKLVESRRDKLERYEALCAKLGEEPAHIGLAWLLHQPGVTAPVIGPRTMEQMTVMLRAMEIKLDAETLAAFDKIWPGPGEAPKAYSR